MAVKKMSKKDLEYFDTFLKEKRKKLVEELDYLEAATNQNQREAGSDSTVGNHLADGASDFTNLETNFDLVQREGKYLVYIEEALEKIRRGTYGICKVCEEVIPKPRLEAVPTATKCVACKEAGKKAERA
ncbi:MAG: TraR/DksA C4-type zinc finger protein [Fibrobacterales bacterium]